MSRWGSPCMLLLFATLVLRAEAQQGLAPSVQADLLRDKIYTQAKGNDADGVLASLDQYHKLVEDNKLVFPTPLYLIEAKAAHDSGDEKRALAALTQLLNNSDHGSNQYKEALTLYSQYEQAVSASNNLREDIKRQALIARIPEVVSQSSETIVMVQAGQLICPKPGTNAKLYCSRSFTELRVAPFEVMKHCVPWFWWDVYIADTGRNSPYDGLQGGSGCAFRR